MSRKLIEKARRRLAAESGCRSNPWGGRLSVGLIYPNTYHHGMSNLGFLSIYHMLNSRDDTLCERFFLPDPEDLKEHRKTGTPLFSLESGRRLTDFDLIAFSISFENDYLNLPALFELAHVPFLSEERDAAYPLVLCGGVCAFLNPEPLADVMDCFAVGEGEVLLPPLIETLNIAGGTSRPELLLRLAEIPGCYVPSFYRVGYRDDGTIDELESVAGAPLPVKRQWLAELDRAPEYDVPLTDETEFGDMVLTEVSRGCSRGCRFCAAGYIYLPLREKSRERLEDDAATGLCRRGRIGLVGAAVSDHPEIDAVMETILEQGGEVSVSSLRTDSLTEREVNALKVSGHRTVALAPEAGSQRLRDLINKGMTEEQILRAARMLAEAGIPNLKLYFLVGLPTETDADLNAVVALTEKVRDLWMAEGKRLGRIGNLHLSVNPMVPKPFTPFQWLGMADEPRLKKKVEALRRSLAPMANVTLNFESVRGSVLQAFLARGDRRISRVIPALARGENLRRACRDLNLDPDFYVTRERTPDEAFPWEIIDTGVRRDYLWEELVRARAGIMTPRCRPGCRRCGVC